MEMLIAISFTAIGLFGGMFFIWKNHQGVPVSQPTSSQSKYVLPKP